VSRFTPLLWTGWARAAALALGPLWLVACSPPPGDSWFPLHVGHEQVYAVSYDTTDPQAPEVWTQTVVREEAWENSTVAVRRHSAGVEFYLQQTDQGIRRVAVRADADGEAQPDEPPRWVLKAPYQVGTEWTTTTVPYLLKRRNEHPRELRHTHTVQLQWRIEAADDTVDIPAGTFTPCLRVVGVGQLNLYTDPVNGFTNVPIVSREWYCRGQGLVKFEREEIVPEGFFTGGVIRAEWVR
jgi:hypothetical protein